MARLTDDHTPAAAWRAALEAWRIPEPILAGARRSPWTLPAAAFTVRARAQLDAPSGVSAEVAAAALPDGGGVLDIGAGAGAASLALRGAAGTIVAVDENAGMSDRFTALAEQAGIPATVVRGRWPDVAPTVPVADVAVCHHVLYNVPDLVPFLVEATGHARRRVVVEVTERHPAALLNPVWRAVHGIDRPERPTAPDALAVVASLGLAPEFRRWQRPITRHGTGFDELVISTTRRLCLGPERRDEIESVLRDLGAGPDRPFLGAPVRDLMTIWWDGSGMDPRP